MNWVSGLGGAEAGERETSNGDLHSTHYVRNSANLYSVRPREVRGHHVRPAVGRRRVRTLAIRSGIGMLKVNIKVRGGVGPMNEGPWCRSYLTTCCQRVYSGVYHIIHSSVASHHHHVSPSSVIAIQSSNQAISNMNPTWHSSSSIASPFQLRPT